MHQRSTYSNHGLILFFQDPLEFKLVQFTEIHQMYASRYDLKKFKGYMQTILKNYKNGTQQFKEKIAFEAWSSQNKKSKGWHLLYALLIEIDSNKKLKANVTRGYTPVKPEFPML